MQVRPFYIAAGAGALVQILFASLSALLVYLMMPAGLDVLENMPPNMFGFTSVIGCFGTLLAPFVHLGVGGLYAYLHANGAPLEVEEGAIGGAASAATARLVAGFFSTLTGLLLTPILLRRFTGPAMPQFPDFDSQFMIFAALFGAASSIIGLCFGALLAGAVGGLGGALGSVLINRKSLP